MTPKLLVLDFDGVIADTFELYFEAFQFAFKAHKLEIDSELLKASLGKRMQDIVGELLPNSSADPAALAEKLKLAINQYLMSPAGASKYHLMPGVNEFLTSLDNNLPIPRIILSNSIVPYITAVLNTGGLESRWTKIIGADSGYESKVHALNALADEYSIEAKEIFFVGDTIFDMQAGLDAGVTRVSITGWHDWDRLYSAHPDYMIEKLEELSRIVKN